METIGKWYRKFLSDMKVLDLSINDMPEEVAKSCLFVHQMALLEECKMLLEKRCREVRQND